jgi:uncharacterized 2Fe-2S/4Fe-4S cluster protein (DUF4445 family)
MKKLMNFVMLLCLLNVLMAGGLVGFLLGTGRLNSAKARTIVDLVRHQGTPPKLREQVYDILEPATKAASGPASQGSTTAGESAGDHPAASAEDRLTFARQAMEQERIALETQAQDLRHRQELLVTLQTDIQDKLAKIEAAKKDSEPKAATAESQAKAESFQKSLDLYAELKPKQIKDIFVDEKDVNLTAKYLGAMDPSFAAKIIGEFKTDDEKKFLDAVLDHIRNAGTGSASDTDAAKEMAASGVGASPPSPQ